MKRTISFAPEYRINRSGDVWNGNMRVFPFNHRGRFGLEHVCVTINGERYPVWSLLSTYWYDNHLILCRDGGVMHWHEDNVFTMTRISKEISTKFDFDEIQYIWYQYQSKKVWCFQLNEKGGLYLQGHTEEEFKILIKDILCASVK